LQEGAGVFKKAPGWEKQMEKPHKLSHHRLRMIEKYLFSLFCLFLGVAVFAQGGPPMLTDDPGTPGDNKWEINIASIAQVANGASVTQAPYMDINYGVGDHLQLKYETGLNAVSSQTFPTGGSQAIAGIKYRFVDEEAQGFDLSTYPQYQFSPSYISNDPAGTTTNFFIPLELTKKFGEFVINPEVGYTLGYGGASNFWTAGFLLAREFKKAELMAEVYSQFPVLPIHPSLILFNIGGRYTISETFTLMGSAGISMSTPVEVPAMDIFYLGLQLHL
jgi:hypothetical protein